MSHLKYSEHRWATVTKYSKEDEFFPGKYCWKDGNTDEPVIRTFKTRKQARKAKKQMSCYKDITKVVKVIVSVDIA